MMKITDEISALTREKQKSFLEYGLRTVRESVALHFDTPDIVFITEGEKEFTPNFAPFVNGKNVIAFSNELNKAIADIERNGNSRIVLLDMALKISGLLRK